MPRSRIRFLSARLGVVLAACLAGMLAACVALPWEAAAATRPPASLPQLIRPLLPGAAADTVKTITADYTCDFSKYGSGIATATVSAAAEVATTWPVSQPDAMALATDKITLPSVVTTALSDVDSFAVASQVAAKHATEATIQLTGQLPVNAASAHTEIPAIVAVGQVTFGAKGTDGSVALPAQSFTVTPMVGATAKPVITCTTATAAQDITITVGDASGAFYHCTLTGSGGAASGDAAFPLALAITETGTKKTGDSLTVSLASPDIAGLISSAASFAAGVGVTLDKATFSADLAVTGAQSGTLHLAKTITDLTATSFSSSAKLKLTKAGTVKVDIPSKLGVGLFTSDTLVIDIACTLVTTPAPVAFTVIIVAGPTPTPTPTASASATGDSGDTDDIGATAEPTGTPVGGAATGGGVTPGGDMPLAIGGAALALTGGGLLLARVTLPRRRKAGPERTAPNGTTSDC